jgi:hypothetical protein
MASKFAAAVPWVRISFLFTVEYYGTEILHTALDHLFEGWHLTFHILAIVKNAAMRGMYKHLFKTLLFILSVTFPVELLDHNILFFFPGPLCCFL